MQAQVPFQLQNLITSFRETYARRLFVKVASSWSNEIGERRIHFRMRTSASSTLRLASFLRSESGRLGHLVTEQNAPACASANRIEHVFKHLIRNHAIEQFSPTMSGILRESARHYVDTALARHLHGCWIALETNALETAPHQQRKQLRSSAT